MQSVLLKENYSLYLGGQEVEGQLHLAKQRQVKAGEHVLVYFDTLDVPPLKTSSLPSASFMGVEGVITSIGVMRALDSRSVQSVRVKRL